MAQVQKLSPEQLQEEFNKIQRAVAFTRGLKRDGSPMTNASSKKLKTGDVEVDVEAPSQDVLREKVDAPSHSQNIPEAQVEVPSQEASVEDVEVPSNIASKAQQTASSLKKVGTKKKLLGRKGVHTSQSTIPIEEGDPDAEHKLCIKYASDEDSASDCDTPYFTSLREILHLVTRADLMTIYGRVMTFYQDKKAEGVGLVLWGDLKILMDSPKVNDGISGLVIHMFVDKKYPLTINLIERMLDHQLEICHGIVGNKLTTAVQLIAFLKKQISDSKRPKVHEWVINSPCYHNKELASPEQTATDAVVPKSVAGSSCCLLMFKFNKTFDVLFQGYEDQSETAKYGKIWYNEDVHDLRSVETEFPAIVFNDNLTSNETLSCEPTVSSLNDEIDFRISFDESDDEDYTVVFDKNSFSYKIISTNDLKTDSENDNEKVNMPLFPSPEPTVSCIDDLDFFKDFENEFPAIVYNDALTSKSDFLTKPFEIIHVVNHCKTFKSPSSHQKRMDDRTTIPKAAAAAVVGGGDGEARGDGDRIDPVMGSLVELGRKSPPEKFSDDGEWRRWWQAAVAGRN
ncbi:hypothetical protein Tco_0320828 [Tanacetum coccineum]